jgi:hypothetical protein
MFMVHLSQICFLRYSLDPLEVFGFTKSYLEFSSQYNKVPRWIQNDYWKGINEKWWKKSECGRFPHLPVAYNVMDTSHEFVGVPL